LKKSVSMSLVVFLALAVVGFAYAAWSGTIEIAGTVEAAKLGLKFTEVSCSDTSEPILDPTCELDGDGTVLTVHVSNAVPGYVATVQYKFRNEGTLPVRIDQISPHADDSWLTIGTSNGGQGVQVAAGEVTGSFYYVTLTCGPELQAGQETEFTITFTGTMVDGVGQ
jgi:hypothetical protein